MDLNYNTDTFVKIKEGKLDFTIKKHSSIFLRHENNADADRCFTVFENLDFEAFMGERVAIVGSNGCGKSTLLRLIAGVYPLSQGKIQVSGSINSLLDLYAGLHPELTGVENTKRLVILANLGPIKIDEFIETVRDFSELGSWLNQPVKSYSSGMTLRLVFSILISLPADIILMDEWLVVGDEQFQKKAQKKLEEYVYGSKLFFLATHDKNLVHSLCNRQIHLSNGSIIFDSKNPR